MCGRNVSLLSRVTPSVLTVYESGTAVPARSMLESKGKVRRRCHEPNKIDSDLSGFMAKPLKLNHAYMDERHSSSFSDQCVTEPYGVEYHLYTVVVGFQSAYSNVIDWVSKD